MVYKKDYRLSSRRKDHAMKKLAPTAILVYLSFPLHAFAQTEGGGASMAFSDRLAVAGRFFGGFLLVMGIIFILLLSTPRLAAWVDKQRKKRNKHDI